MAEQVKRKAIMPLSLINNFTMINSFYSWDTSALSGFLFYENTISIIANNLCF